MYSDSTDQQKKVSSELQQELFLKFSPYIHRKDASLLRSILPQLYDTLVTIRSSSTQDKLMKNYKDYCEDDGDKNFFRYVHTNRAGYEHLMDFDFDLHQKDLFDTRYESVALVMDFLIY